MRHFVTIITALSCLAAAKAQTAEDIMLLVERNNVSLKRYKAQCEAVRTEAFTGITLADPEVEFNYLWGSPHDVGARKDFSVTQSVDLATLFGTRRREARSRAELAEMQYGQARLMVLFAAQQAVIELTTANRIVSTLRQRLNTARSLEERYRKLLKAGEVSKPESGRIALSRATLQAELRTREAERMTLLARLQALCGDSIDYTSEEYPVQMLRGNMSSDVARQESEVAKRQIEVARRQGLPELKMGYMSELTREEKFRGITFGMSVPLWSNRRNVQRARAAYASAEAASREEDFNIAARCAGEQQRVRVLGELCGEIRALLSQNDNTALMRKALDAGEISVIEFLTERENYYALQDRLLSTEADYHSALAQLQFLGQR